MSHKPFTPAAKAHPSGRPRRENKRAVRTDERPPREGFLLPRLEYRRHHTYAIGFHASPPDDAWWWGVDGYPEARKR